MSVRDAQARIDAREFAEWMAYYTLEPWGEERADLSRAVIAAAVANTTRRKGSRAYRPMDFQPDYDPEPAVDRVTRKLDLFFAQHEAVRRR